MTNGSIFSLFFSNAKIPVMKNDKWKHVAYVEKDDAMELRKYGRLRKG